MLELRFLVHFWSNCRSDALKPHQTGLLLVEMGGVEPPSESTLPLALHA